MEMSTPHEMLGLQCNSFPTLNTLLGGHRKGELTILTGATGIGKTYKIIEIILSFIIWRVYFLNMISSMTNIASYNQVFQKTYKFSFCFYIKEFIFEKLDCHLQ
jgi:twinkle protein